MLFLGDLSIPNAECGQKLVLDMKRCGVFEKQVVVVNLEGVLHQNNPQDIFWKVYNDSSAMELQTVCKQLVFGLANNHLYDYPEKIQPMLEILRENKIPYFGMRCANGDILPLEIQEHGVEYAIFGHCWEVYTKTNRNEKTDDRIADCSYSEFYQMVVQYINKHPSKKVICYLHWNFDLEELPFPAHKKLAHDLIDYGVEAVIGNHAHCEQEVEMYHGKVIAYGLGNFYMPDGYFFDGTLRYSEKSHRTMGIQLSPEGVLVHEFETDFGGDALKLTSTSVCDQSEKTFRMEESYDEKAYEKVFRKERKKRKLTPIFYTYENSLGTRFKTTLCIWKIHAIRFVKQLRDKRR